MADEKKLTFKIHKGESSEIRNPRWVETEVENAECPKCHQEMIVILGFDGLLYAYCPRDKKYFVGE
jgi:hypothetical protein